MKEHSKCLNKVEECLASNSIKIRNFDRIFIDSLGDNNNYGLPKGKYCLVAMSVFVPVED